MMIMLIIMEFSTVYHFNLTFKDVVKNTIMQPNQRADKRR